MIAINYLYNINNINNFKRMKKKLLVLLIAVAAIIVNLGAQTIVLSESFEKGIPAGWTQESVFGDQKWVTEPLVSGESLLYPDGVVSGCGRIVSI